ncbi:hypothetical protein GCM10009836_49770 [Pseudonocardia ailaonensis]|uniref:Uncharacterized protein n=1 Tax=Pseudonocardia ailaonensis TaxID=367279 RepID=A0ABN2NF09_9PSEU
MVLDQHRATPDGDPTIEWEPGQRDEPRGKLSQQQFNRIVVGPVSVLLPADVALLVALSIPWRVPFCRLSPAFALSIAPGILLFVLLSRLSLVAFEAAFLVSTPANMLGLKKPG